MEIGEAVKNIDSDLLESEVEIEWNLIARMRDVLIHHYHDTDFAVVELVIMERLPLLSSAVHRLKERIESKPYIVNCLVGYSTYTRCKLAGAM